MFGRHTVASTIAFLLDLALLWSLVELLGVAHLPAAIIAELDGAIAGFATVLPRDDGAAELEDLFVDPAAWGLGIGRRLVAEAERRAAALGARALHVVAGDRARPFYERCGFRVTGPMTTDLEPASTMRKDLVR